VQYITPHTATDFPVTSFAAREDFEAWVSTLAQTPFDVYGNLFQPHIYTMGRNIGYVIHIHHLIADAWTVHLIANTISQNLKNEEVTAYSYLDYIATEKEYEASPRYQKDKAYFLQNFKQCPEPVFLSEKQAQNIDTDHLSITMDKNHAAQIQAFCSHHSITPYTMFMNALATYISRIKGKQDLYIGTAVLNRAGKKEKSTAGMFINNIPLLMGIDETKTTLENIHGNAERISSIFRHQKYQYSDLLTDIREAYGPLDRLFDVVLSYQNATMDDDAASQWHFPGCQSEGLIIHINDRYGEGHYSFDYSYQPELYTQENIQQMHSHLLNIIMDTVANPHKKPQELKLLSSEEYHQVIHGFNNTTIDCPNNKFIHQLIEDRAAQTPDKPAIEAADATLTYTQVNQQANKVAHALIHKNIKADDVVAMVLPRKSYLIPTMLGILKSGGAYLPLDPNYPPDRISHLLQDSGAKATITTREYAHKAAGDVLFIEDLLTSTAAHNPNIYVNPGNLFCALHTSGSTGMPKTAGLMHKNVYYYYYYATHYLFAHVDNVLSTTIVSFDAFLHESLLPLCDGIKVIFFSEEELGNQVLFERKVEQYQNCGIFQTPTKLESNIKNSKTKTFLKHINAFYIGGEVFTKNLYELITAHNNNKNTYNWYGPTECTISSSVDIVSKMRIHNGYGPVETTLGCCFEEVISSDITIGKPLPNAQIYILDKWLNPLPIGTVGELHISGDGVGRGYLGRPDLTAEKFIPNPFRPGSTMYKSGDLAMWRPDGRLEYVGRMDNQVKIRGLRIELSEIEAAIAQHSGIKQVTLTDKKDETGRQYICAYYISDAPVDEKALRAQIAKTLPQYMVPHFFTRLEAYPTTSSGKVDRKALPMPDFTATPTAAEYTAPATKLEEAIATLVQQVLGIERVGKNDNFFELGGDSLKAIEFVTKAQHQGVTFTLQDVFDHPTVTALAQSIEGVGRETAFTKNDKIDLEEINSFLAQPKLIGRDLGNVFITGATGWLGAHVLDAFLSTQPGDAYCLVRGESPAASHIRLHAMLGYYFGGKYVNSQRIRVVCGDITSPIHVDGDVNTIVHCAANVRHYGVYQDSYDINVEGTNNVLAFAKAKDARLLHISTVSVSGNGFQQMPGFVPTVFDETKLYIGQSLENVYIRSKFEAEIAVLQARLTGLDAAVIRVGNLVNRQSDLKFQENHGENATLTRLKAFMDLGLYPWEMEQFPLEFSPVDDTAAAVVALAQYGNNREAVYHVYHGKPFRFKSFVKAANRAGFKLRPVSLEMFVEAVRGAEAHIKEAFIHDISPEGKLLLDASITPNNKHTTRQLKTMGFKWRKINRKYLEKYIQYFTIINYFTPNK